MNNLASKQSTYNEIVDFSYLKPAVRSLNKHERIENEAIFRIIPLKQVIGLWGSCAATASSQLSQHLLQTYAVTSNKFQIQHCCLNINSIKKYQIPHPNPDAYQFLFLDEKVQYFSFLLTTQNIIIIDNYLLFYPFKFHHIIVWI